MAMVVVEKDLLYEISTETAYVKSGVALTELPDSADSVSVQIGAVVTMQLPVTVGQSHVQVDKSLAKGYDLDGDGLPDAMSIKSVVTVQGIETASVGIGTFADSAHVQTVVTLTATSSANGTTSRTLTTIDEWYAPNLGLIRQSTVTEGGGQRQVSSRELADYAVGGRKSSARAPLLSRSVPAAGVTVQGLYQMQFSFDQSMDIETLRNGGLSLMGPDGQALPFTLTQNGTATELAAYISGGLPEGNSTVRLSTVGVDLLGNAQAQQEWVIHVDHSAPAVLRAQPAAGAVDVPLNTTVRLQFSEPLNPAMVNSTNVVLRDGIMNTYPVTVSMPDPQTILVVPQQSLAAGNVYFVELTPSVNDMLGNAVGNTTVATQFYTVQGQLSAPMKLTGAAGRGLAYGDINSDGRVDLVTIQDGGAPWVSAFNVYLQNSTGRFELPYAVDTPARENSPTAGLLLLADMDGDGRVDIVSTRGGYGVEVAYQGLDGLFSRSLHLQSIPGLNMFKVADLDGDGLLDVVAAAWGSELVSVWRQQPNGNWAPEVLYPLFNNGRGDIAIGDLNGDGRSDLVVTSGQGDVQRGLGISYQQQDGSFGTPQYTSGVFGPVVIADVDGDGRMDLLTGSSGVTLFRQQANGSLATPVVIPNVVGVSKLQVADLDGDGLKDLVIGMDGYAPFVAVQWQNADGSFTAPKTFRGGEPGTFNLFGMVVADLNGDGRPDVALSGPVVLLNAGGRSDPAMTRVDSASVTVREGTRRTLTNFPARLKQVASTGLH
ncbi:MAG: VCBS repeat-containing protein [Burkholderiales bacterium]|nr:VCBS repeat-containing protein [Burkholderiales bacterium]